MRATNAARLVVMLIVLFATVVARAQELDSLLKMSTLTEESELQKALNKGLTISSSKALSTREAPGIVSVISSEEIQNSGARDLTDILRMVPGFDIGQDIMLVMGVGIRGNWANEGKVLLMVDGQPFNELLYQTLAVGNRFPVDAIEQIEIIRGPGSAIYGGSAEYGVINIKTKASESLHGVSVFATGGFHANTVGRTNGGVAVAQKGEKFSWDASLFRGKGIVSDSRTYQNILGDDSVQRDLSATKANPLNLNVGLKFKGLTFRTMYDEFITGDAITYVSYKGFSADVKYLIKVNKKLTLTPQIKYYNQIPWSWGSAETGEAYFKVKAQRTLLQLQSDYDVSRKINLNFGAIYFTDIGTDLLDSTSFAGSRSMTLNNFAFFAQGLMKHRIANATIGFRFEKNNRYGAAFVPRIGLTKKIENFHFKVLYSQAFRAPSIENINSALNGNMIPEKSNVFEFELGYQFTPEMLFVVNAFSITTRHIITYGSGGTPGVDFLEWYANATKAGTRGFEAIYNIRKKAWYAHVTYSFSNAIAVDSTLINYAVPQTARQYVGMPVHKITLNTNFNITSKITFNPTFIYSGKRYAYDARDSNGNTVCNPIDPYVLANSFLNFRNLFSGCTAGIGVYDIFNQRPPIPQAYDGSFVPIPARSREYVVKISYVMNFKKQ